MSMEKLVKTFAENVAKQNACIQEGNSVEGNKAAKKYIKAFRDIIAQFGDEGRDALTTLFFSQDDGIRAMAAAFLLRYKTEESKKILSEISTGNDFVSFGAGETLKRWNEGVWALDPVEKNYP